MELRIFISYNWGHLKLGGRESHQKLKVKIISRKPLYSDFKVEMNIHSSFVCLINLFDLSSYGEGGFSYLNNVTSF